MPTGCRMFETIDPNEYYFDPRPPDQKQTIVKASLSDHAVVVGTRPSDDSAAPSHPMRDKENGHA